MTFCVGLSIASLLSRKQSRDELASLHTQSISLRSRPCLDKQWGTIYARRISFCVPPTLKNVRFSDDPTLVETLTGVVSPGNSLNLRYSYGSAITTNSNYFVEQTAEIVIDGRPARLSLTRVEAGECRMVIGGPKFRPGMNLFIADAGDGSKFELTADSYDADTVRKIVASVEIR